VATTLEHPVSTPPAPAPAIIEVRVQPQAHEDGTSSLKSLASTVIIALFVITFVVQAFQIPSESMENTLLIGDYLLVDKASYGSESAMAFPIPYREVKRGDVIVFRYPVDPNQHFVKRVVGIPGDRIHLENGRVFVNRQLLSEPFALYKRSYKDGFRDNFPTTRFFSTQAKAAWLSEFPGFIRGADLIVPEGNYFVLGDNRNESSDSRYWGFVPRENIVGRPLLIYFSVGSPDDQAVTGTRNAKIDGFMARISSLPGAVRWNRAFRFVK
jgi:signal peptidase I